MRASLDGQIIAAADDGRAGDLDALLAQHPRQARASPAATGTGRCCISAAEGGHLACVERAAAARLRRRTARPAATTPPRCTGPRSSGILRVVERLLDAGADIDGEGDVHEVGVIGWATCFRSVRARVADYLLARGAKPTIFSAVALDRADLVRQLVAADPALLRARKMSRFEHHRTPLHLAVLKNRPADGRLLLELGADASAKDSRGYTPLNLVDREDRSRRSPPC